MLTILSRDLHPNNIFVTKIHYPDGPSEGRLGFDILLSDFGESKRLGDGDWCIKSASGNFACAIGDYMPMAGLLKLTYFASVASRR